jgi:peptidoglycan/xylan/chitin deacetylase (PgdA/CDA1 family)
MFVFSIMVGFLSVVKAETSVALWQGDKKGAVSMTFEEVDDGDEKSGTGFENGFPLLQQHGLKATFFVFAGDPNENDVRALAADGQEVGSFGMSNTPFTSLSPAFQQYQLSQSQTVLEGLTGREVTTFAYPYGDYDTDLIGFVDDYYIAARTANSGALNGPTRDIYKLYIISPTENGSDDPNIIDYLQDSVELAVTENEWAIEQFHAIGDSGYNKVSIDALSAHMGFLAANEPDLWVAPMGTVAEYIYERDAASITTIFQDSSRMQLDVQCGLDSRFNTPLTLLTDYPLDWAYGEIHVTQGSTQDIATVVVVDGSYYMMYDAVPDGGTVELSVNPLEPIDFTMTASAGPNGSIDPGGEITGAWNADQTFTAIADPNYVVDQWFVDGVAVQSGTRTYTLTDIRADHTVHVTFKPYLATVALWQGDKKGAVSMTFDDGMISQFNNALPLLQAHGLKATFFIVVDYLGYDAFMDELNIGDLAAAGQEIGSHSLTHSDLTSLDLSEQGDELSMSQSTLQGLSGQDVTTFAYPAGDYDADVIAMTDDYYIAARTANAWALNASLPDLYTLNIIGPNDGGTGDPNVISYLQGWVDGAVADNKWAIEMFHSVDYPGGEDNVSSTALSTHMDYLVANEPNVWTAPMGTVAEYIYERDAASVTTLISDSNVIQLDLHCGLDNRFDTPLTLLSPCLEGWESEVVYVKQGLTEQIADIVFKDGSYYMMYDALPDAGTIEVSLTPPDTIDFTMNASAGPNGSIDPDGEFIKALGSDQIFTAIPDPGYLVDQWVVDGVTVQSGASTFTLTQIAADQSVLVTFKPYSATVALWQGDKKGAVSMTFDDGMISQFNNALPLLQEHGLGATFFIVADYFGYGAFVDEPNVVDLAAAGQEIGSHSYTHSDLRSLEPWEQDFELSWSKSTLEGLLSEAGYEQDVTTFAYPYGAYDASIIAATDDYYIAARSAGISSSSNASSPNLYALNIITPNEGGYGDPNVIPYLQDRVDDAVSENEWAIEMFHSVNYPGGEDNISSTALSTHMDYLVANETNVWVAPMGTVAEYIYERDAASVTTLVSDGNMIQLDLHCGLDNRFDTPLTLLTACPESWESGVILVKQGQTEQIVDIVSRNGSLYMMYNATPDAGTIELSPVVFEISGHILSPAGVPLPAVTVTADNGGGESLTDSNGYFQMSFGNEWAGMVTPSKQDYTFDPSSYVDVVAGAELSYTGRHIADLLADGVIDGYDLQILCENWLAAVSLDIDIVDDGQINLKDFSIFAEHWLDEY